MDSSNKDEITRRKFVKGVTGAAVCCACLSLDRVTASEGKEGKTSDGNARVHLAGACGIFCGSCPAYLARHGDDEQIKLKRQKISSSEPGKAVQGIPPVNWMKGLLCDGCLSGGELAGHCQMCNIRLHALETQENSRCSGCEELPCYRINGLINMGNYLHRKEYLPNLKKIREMGLEEWAKHEEERWRCQKCGLTMSWYDPECIRCKEPRSGRLFVLPEDI
ncbi:MAG: DUF3795 domain-containing protein [Deltaproteobacteria bacterium]|jgi:hypothetical protein|nr:DUF3795 domain-containing protein [Deltaproteobacteria bacterium]